MTRQEYIELIKNTAKKSILDSTLKILVGRFSFLAFGPANVLTVLILKKIIAIIVEETEMRLFFLYTDFRVSEQGRLFIERARSYEEIKKTGSEDQKKLAEIELINAFRDLAKLR